MNSHLLKGVATMAELTKVDSRQSMGKIKPTDKMVMMPSLFDGTKPAMSKRHYERFNLYINFQTKSGHLTDPVREAIDLFEHTLDKTALVWFQKSYQFSKDMDIETKPHTMYFNGNSNTVTKINQVPYQTIEYNDNGMFTMNLMNDTPIEIFIDNGATPFYHCTHITNSLFYIHTPNPKAIPLYIQGEV